jgi:NADH dehydrogenase/NADH:ubiquinone oxidoreductase subunit G
VAVPAALLADLDFLVLQAPQEGRLGAVASVLLPGRTPLEKKGTFVNATGQRQLVRPAVDPGEGVPEDWMLWRDLAGERWSSLRQVQTAMAAAGVQPATARKRSTAEKAEAQPASATSGLP